MYRNLCLGLVLALLLIIQLGMPSRSEAALAGYRLPHLSMNGRPHHSSSQLLPAVTAPGTQLPSAWIDHSEEGLQASAGTLITITGSGSDNDEDSNTITTFEWFVDGLTVRCPKPVLSIDAGRLGPGSYTVFLRAQDDEGDWSPWARAELVVIEGSAYRIFLPQLSR